MPHLKGSTYTKRAFSTAWNEFWEPTINDPERDRITVLITDGEADVNQEPCAWAQKYLDEGIDIIGVGIGLNDESLTLNCIETAEVPKILASDWTQSDFIAQELFTRINPCVGQQISYTPYNGAYSRIQGEIFNGRYVYMHSEGWIVRFQNEVPFFCVP